MITSAPSASTKEEDTVEVDDAPHYLLKRLERPQPLNATYSNVFHVYDSFV
jgi:hypothetical protein